MGILGKYDETCESQGYKCPYCGEQHFCDDWGYDYDGEKLQCEECKKYFYATASHTTDFRSRADCELNDEKHQFEFRTFNDPNEGAFFCKVCGECKLKES